MRRRRSTDRSADRASRDLEMRCDEVFLDSITEGDAARVHRNHPLIVRTQCVPTSIAGHAAAMTVAIGVLFDYAAAHAKSRVDAAVQVRDGCAVVSVGDDGSSVPSARRIDFLTRSDDLTSIVRAHHGRIDVTETLRGSAIVVTLPGAWIRREPDGRWL